MYAQLQMPFHNAPISNPAMVRAEGKRMSKRSSTKVTDETFSRPAADAAHATQSSLDLSAPMLTTHEHSKEELMRKLSQVRAHVARAGGEAQNHETQSKTKDDVEALVDLDDKKKLRNKALRLLTTREHSKEELMRKLAQAKIRTALRNNTEKNRENVTREKDDIEALVSSLVAQGWQSDERYAESMVRRLSGQVSKKFIIEKLAQNGIAKDAAQHAVDVIEIDDFESASALWQRKFGAAPTDDRTRQRQVRFLLSRGFHLSDAFKIVPKVKGGVERGDE